MSSVNIGYKVSSKARLGIWLQSLGDHDWTEIRASNADIDNVCDGLAGVSLPFARSDSFREFFHVCEDLVDRTDDILTVVLEWTVSRVAKCWVKDCTVFRDVDVLTVEELVPKGLDACFFGEGNECLEGIIGDQILGEIKKNACIGVFSFEGARELFESLGIFLKEVLCDDVLTDFVIVSLEGLPRGELQSQ